MKDSYSVSVIFLLLPKTHVFGPTMDTLTP